MKANLSEQEKKRWKKSLVWMRGCSNNEQMQSGVVRGNKEKKKR